MQVLVIIEAPGKVQKWERIMRMIGTPAVVVATGGHICAFPKKLTPLGINPGRAGQLEYGRRVDEKKAETIISAVKAMPQSAAIVVAMDNDVEGNVIALDVVELIATRLPGRQSRMARVYPGAITPEGVRAALASGRRVNSRKMHDDAVQGRARAVTDRWIGATFSRMAGLPVGRVRSAVLGATYLLNALPDKLISGRPETGEITFQARSAMGGRPFVARVALTGAEPVARVRKLAALAQKYAGHIIPGSVRPLRSLSAAIAPREGSVRPFNTADALAYAGRHYGISSALAMKGLQDAYEEGLISYPRTPSRSISTASASKVVMLGYSCGLTGLQTERLADEGRVTPDGRVVSIVDHEALHPVMALSANNSSKLRQWVRRPVREPQDGWGRGDIRDLMTTLVARRAFEAGKEITLERGNWGMTNNSGMSAQDVEILQDLDWQREVGYNFPWTRSFSTGVRDWPMEAVLLDLMASERLGRPSTYAAHLSAAMQRGEIEEAEFPNPPRPSPSGKQSLKKTPAPVWNPATSRLIEATLENLGNRLKEDRTASVAERARHRPGILVYQNAQGGLRASIGDVGFKQ